MRVSLKGVRGSIPTTGPDTKYYGGNTSCTVVSENGWTLVMDGGSGMQQLKIGGNSDANRVDILLTHLHLDHIQGLGFFKPLFDRNMEVHIWGPISSTHSLHARLSRYLSPPLFPVLLRDLPCKLVLHEIANSQFDIGPFLIQSAYIIHPGPTVGFRVRGTKSVFTYLPDHEPALGRNGMVQDRHWISGITLAADADLLYHDAQFSPVEYKDKLGWGHSSIDDAALFGSMAGVKHILFGHHDPGHSDSNLTDLFTNFSAAHSYHFLCEMAVEGMEVEL